MKKIAASVLTAVAFVSALAVAATSETIEDRIKPVGELCMAGDPCAAAVVAVSSSSEPRTGESIYGTACTTCHAAGVAGAPKFGDVAAWAPRIEKGLETLYEHSINGFNGMPAKGMCFDCSDDEMKAAVDYIVNSAQ